MYTQCPYCHTVFGVADEHLAAAAGQVRCGHCEALFNAEENLLIDLPGRDSEATIEEPTLSIEESDIETVSAESPNVESDIEVPNEEGQVEEDDTEATEELAPIYRQSALAPPPDDDQATLNAIFADLDTRLVRMSEPVDEVDIEIEADDEVPERIEPTIDLSLEDIDATPSTYKQDTNKPYIDTDDLASFEETDFTDTDEPATATAPAKIDEPRAKPRGNWAEVDTDPSVEYIPNKLTEPEEVKPTHSFLFEEGELEQKIAAQTVDDEIPAAEEWDDEQIDSVKPATRAFSQEELPFHLRDAFEAPAEVPRSRWKIFIISLLFLLASVGMVFQMALFRSVELANKLPQLKPYLVQFCHYFPCSFSGQRDIKRIHITNREVRGHPDMKNALLVTAIFINRAEFSQPYPDIVLSLSDLTNTIVAQRRFTPDDYLTKGKDRFQLMKPNVPIQVQLEVLDPGNDAVNFEFTFK